jgi:heptaprenyl diphosphate synthase
MPAQLARVEQALRDSVVTDDDFLTEMASHLIPAGGKRLRPAVAVAAAAVGGRATTHEVILGGVSVELVHLGSLYHDDVIDEAEMRRTVESVNARWGNLRAILAGDFLLARASEIAAGLGTEVAALLANTIARLCEGEVRELQSMFDVERTREAYVRSIEGKTAALFASACRIGAIVEGLPRSTIDALTEYGRALGIVFQIADDVLDITRTDAELGKPAGHDLVEGVYTLPVLLALAGSEGRDLRHLLGQRVDGPELEKALDIVRSSGGVEGAVAAGRRFADDASASLAGLPEGPALDALRAAPHALLDSLA